jgi:hypothetical protein
VIEGGAGKTYKRTGRNVNFKIRSLKMYYYFDKNTPNWNEPRRRKLAWRLEELADTLPLDANGLHAYVEEYPGHVAIRRITHYTPGQIDDIVNAAKVIYKVVMMEDHEEPEAEEKARQEG